MRSIKKTIRSTWQRAFLTNSAAAAATATSTTTTQQNNNIDRESLEIFLDSFADIICNKRVFSSSASTSTPTSTCTKNGNMNDNNGHHHNNINDNCKNSIIITKDDDDDDDDETTTEWLIKLSLVWYRTHPKNGGVEITSSSSSSSSLLDILWKFSKLEFLELRQCPCMTLPSGIGQLTTLTTLIIEGIPHIPKEIALLCNLQILSLRDCGDDVFPFLKSLKSLEKLSIFYFNNSRSIMATRATTPAAAATTAATTTTTPAVNAEDGNSISHRHHYHQQQRHYHQYNNYHQQQHQRQYVNGLNHLKDITTLKSLHLSGISKTNIIDLFSNDIDIPWNNNNNNNNGNANVCVLETIKINHCDLGNDYIQILPGLLSISSLIRLFLEGNEITDLNGFVDIGLPQQIREVSFYKYYNYNNHYCRNNDNNNDNDNAAPQQQQQTAKDLIQNQLDNLNRLVKDHSLLGNIIYPRYSLWRSYNMNNNNNNNDINHDDENDAIDSLFPSYLYTMLQNRCGRTVLRLQQYQTATTSTSTSTRRTSTNNTSTIPLSVFPTILERAAYEFSEEKEMKKDYIILWQQQGNNNSSISNNNNMIMNTQNSSLFSSSPSPSSPSAEIVMMEKKLQKLQQLRLSVLYSMIQDNLPVLLLLSSS